MLGRSIRKSPGRCPNQPNPPRITIKPITTAIAPAETMSSPIARLSDDGVAENSLGFDDAVDECVDVRLVVVDVERRPCCRSQIEPPHQRLCTVMARANA